MQSGLFKTKMDKQNPVTQKKNAYNDTTYKYLQKIEYQWNRLKILHKDSI